MKKTLAAMILMCGSAFAQYPNPAGAGVGAPGYYPPAGQYGDPSGAYPVQDPYSVGVGAYPAPLVCGPGYVWIDGYNDVNGYFVNGYCAVPPFSGAYWIAPSFFGGRFVSGYWGRGGIGYGSSFSVRGGYRSNYGVRGGYRESSHGRYDSGFRAPAASRSSRSQGVAPNVRSSGGSRGSGSATRGGGSATRSSGSARSGSSSRGGRR